MGLSGISHWLILLLIVLILFGVGRVSGLMGELGKGIKSFKEGLGEGDKQADKKQIPPQQQQQPIDITPNRPAEPTSTANPPAGEDQSRH